MPYRHVALAARHAFQYMTITSLLAWCSTSRDNYIDVRNKLHSSLVILVAHFFPDPHTFLELLAPWGALIVGKAALSHMLQDLTVCRTLFEVAIGNLFFQPFVDSLARLFPPHSQLHTHLDKPSPQGFAFHHHITCMSEFHLVSGLVIVIYEFCTPSACDILSRSWTTALMNFVTGYTFGCAYPQLTFNKCTIICNT